MFSDVEISWMAITDEVVESSKRGRGWEFFFTENKIVKIKRRSLKSCAIIE